MDMSVLRKLFSTMEVDSIRQLEILYGFKLNQPEPVYISELDQLEPDQPEPVYISELDQPEPDLPEPDQPEPAPPEPTLEVTNDEKYEVDETQSGKMLVFQCLNSEDFQVDADDEVYALKLNDISAGMVRFKVSKCSTIFFAAVYIEKYDVLHSGLVIENDFEVSLNGTTTVYDKGHLVAHALFVKNEKKTLDTKLLVCMCSTRDAVFNELASVVDKNATTYRRAMSSGFMSSLPCFKLVKKLQSEIKKPFDEHWSTRLKGKAEALGNNVTNCAIFAGRMIYTLAPTPECKSRAKEGMLKVFKELGTKESVVKPYISALATE